MMALAALSLLALGSPVSGTAPAGPWVVRPGQRVRVQAARPPREVVGELIAVDETILTLRVKGASLPVQIPKDTVERLDLSRGRPRRASALKGLGLGFAAGAVAGYMFLGSGSDCADNRFCVASPTGWTLGSGMAGGVLGFAIGALAPAERWEAVGPRSARVRLGPHPGGVAVALSLSF